jgi:hypothetical protein
LGDCLLRLFLTIAEVTQIFGFFGQFVANFCTVKVIYSLILTKNALGYILGEFFTYSSGHPDLDSSAWP